MLLDTRPASGLLVGIVVPAQPPRSESAVRIPGNEGLIMGASNTKCNIQINTWNLQEKLIAKSE